MASGSVKPLVHLGLSGISGNQTIESIKDVSETGIYHVYFYDTTYGLDGWGTVIAIIQGNIRTINCTVINGKSIMLHTSDGINWAQRVW